MLSSCRNDDKAPHPQSEFPGLLAQQRPAISHSPRRAPPTAPGRSPFRDPQSAIRNRLVPSPPGLLPFCALIPSPCAPAFLRFASPYFPTRTRGGVQYFEEAPNRNPSPSPPVLYASFAASQNTGESQLFRPPPIFRAPRNPPSATSESSSSYLRSPHPLR